MAASTAAQTSRRPGIARAVMALPIAVLLGAVVVIALPAGQRTNGQTGAFTVALIGEHSALGDRQVDRLNAAIASMGRARGEHAGMSRTDIEAER